MCDQSYWLWSGHKRLLSQPLHNPVLYTRMVLLAHRINLHVLPDHTTPISQKVLRSWYAVRSAWQLRTYHHLSIWNIHWLHFPLDLDSLFLVTCLSLDQTRYHDLCDHLDHFSLFIALWNIADKSINTFVYLHLRFCTCFACTWIFWMNNDKEQ